MKLTYHLHNTPFRLPFFLALLVVFSLFFTQCKEGPLDTSSRQHGTDESLAFNVNNDNRPTLPDGALYYISLPDRWNDLVIYAHGYVNPQERLALPDDSVEDRSVSEIVNELGMAYATTSYRANGLVGPEAVEDLVQLVNIFVEQHGRPDHIYLVGVSEGAMITTMAVEQHSDVFSGGLAGCGPIGSFRKQVDYLGDFHVLFNYFYPEPEVGIPSGVPGYVIENWLGESSSLKQQVRNALAERPGVARTLMRVASVPVQNESNHKEIEGTIFDLLHYNVLATNNAIDRLNGLPFNNPNREYSGTGSARGDSILNREIKRFRADAPALESIKNEFETSGDLPRPLVTMHTTGDQEVPYWHEPIYQEKAFRQGSLLQHSNLPIIGRYGHCNFKLHELLVGFAVMVVKVSLHDLIVPVTMFPDKQAKQEFLELSHEQGVTPVIQPTPQFEH